MMILLALSCVRLFTTAWTAAYQTPLSMGFSRQEYWSGLSIPTPETVYTSTIFISLNSSYYYYY